MRQTGNRATDFRRGTRLGREDHLVEWHRHRNRWPWMSRQEFAAMPRVLVMRELRVRVEQRGFRTRRFVVVTTLLDATVSSRKELEGLYRARWNAEIDIRTIKETLRMDVLRCKAPELVVKEIWAHLLRCKAPELVVKEIWAHLLAYNLLRDVMAEVALRHGLAPREVSFQGARPTLEAFRRESGATTAGDDPRIERLIHRAIASHRVGDRPDRIEPRVIKRRPQHYPRMQVPRRIARKRLMGAG
jgi:hypothetical protein